MEEVYYCTSLQEGRTLVNVVGYHCYQLHTKMLSNILPSGLSPYIDEIIVDHQCGFRRNRSTIDQYTCWQIIYRNWLNYYAYLHEYMKGTNNGEWYLSEFFISESIDRSAIKFYAEGLQPVWIGYGPYQSYVTWGSERLLNNFFQDWFVIHLGRGIG
jgi:hypothetical protein